MQAEAQRSEAARQAAAASTTPSVAVTSPRLAHLASTGVKSNNLFHDEDGGDEDSARIGAAKGLAGVFIPAGAAEYHTDETRHASEAIDEKLLSAGASGDDLDKLADLNVSAKPAAVSIAAPQAATSASADPEVDNLDDLEISVDGQLLSFLSTIGLSHLAADLTEDEITYDRLFDDFTDAHFKKYFSNPEERGKVKGVIQTIKAYRLPTIKALHPVAASSLASPPPTVSTSSSSPSSSSTSTWHTTLRGSSRRLTPTKKFRRQLEVTLKQLYEKLKIGRPVQQMMASLMNKNLTYLYGLKDFENWEIDFEMKVEKFLTENIYTVHQNASEVEKLAQPFFSESPSISGTSCSVSRSTPRRSPSTSSSASSSSSFLPGRFDKTNFSAREKKIVASLRDVSPTRAQANYDLLRNAALLMITRSRIEEFIDRIRTDFESTCTCTPTDLSRPLPKSSISTFLRHLALDFDHVPGLRDYPPCAEVSFIKELPKSDRPKFRFLFATWQRCCEYLHYEPLGRTILFNVVPETSQDGLMNTIDQWSDHLVTLPSDCRDDYAKLLNLLYK